MRLLEKVIDQFLFYVSKLLMNEIILIYYFMLFEGGYFILINLSQYMIKIIHRIEDHWLASKSSFGSVC